MKVAYSFSQSFSSKNYAIKTYFESNRFLFWQLSLYHKIKLQSCKADGDEFHNKGAKS